MIPVAKPYLTQDEAQSAYDVVLSGWVTQGPKVEELEKKFAEYVGVPYAVALSNCTTALHLAMIVAGIKEGDEVICPSMSYIATANAIRYVNAKPVFADVDPFTYNISVDHTRRLVTSKTKAILIVHQIGMPADIDAFRILCNEQGLILIEDAACAVGSTYKGKKIGCHSDLVCFSFHPRKVISTGEGGMITTSNKNYAERLRLLRQHGMAINDRVRHSSNKILISDHIELGYNYRMTDIQAAIGIKQLEKLDWIVDQRRKIADYYRARLKDVSCLRLPLEPQKCRSNFQSYCVYVNQEYPRPVVDLMQDLLDAGVSTRSGIMLTHKETAYKELYSQTSLPVSEDLLQRCLLLPLYVPMSKDDVDKVINELLKAVTTSVR
ncbi:aminotransferase DegT [Cytophagales bacterium WSM2-2]|nr:aminotransferase DegT [Cytophagales bacterium WSM2-2]